MDLIEACRAFVAVHEFGGFSHAAAATHVQQSVVSRRVASLERHLGHRLFERSSRRVQTTSVGEGLVPLAQDLVRQADRFGLHARQLIDAPITVALPGNISVIEAAGLAAAARAAGTRLLVTRSGSAAERHGDVRASRVRAALIAVPHDEARWCVPLGVAGSADEGGGAFLLESIRPAPRARTRPRRLLLQPEDDVPHIRDTLARLAARRALTPEQCVMTTSLVDAVADVLGGADLLLCSSKEAAELGLAWRAMGDATVLRGYAVSAVVHEDRVLLEDRLSRLIGNCVGARRQAS